MSEESDSTVDSPEGGRQYQGPAGGDGGRPFFDDSIASGDRIAEIRIWSGSVVDSIQLVLIRGDGSIRTLDRHGGSGGDPSSFSLARGESIVRIWGRCGDLIDKLNIQTSAGKTYTFGGGGGRSTYSFSVPQGQKFDGFWGRSGSLIDALGIIHR
ncbi:jacalin-like lectin [Alienimonas sp. DA493]|uniref:jacalin-like lectin n=1 Tax=Alienimonas sp. DA493 TaxID=3373605 RepID=UPI0037551CDB